MNTNNSEVLERAIETCKSLFDQELRSRYQCKVYDFLPILNANDIYPWSDKPFLALYQKQYIIQASLIELQEDYRILNKPSNGLKPAPEDRKLLMLSPVNVALVEHECLEQPDDELSQELEDAAASVVIQHYRDYDRFFDATEDTVVELLQSFWAKFSALDDKDEAYVCLELSSGAPWEEVQAQYRAMASAHHPDRGGDQEKFIQIRKAFETLKAYYK